MLLLDNNPTPKLANAVCAYFPPEEIGKHVIKCIWKLREYAFNEREECILPKGTVEIIFNLSDEIVYCNPGLNIRSPLPACFINGINFKPFSLVKKGPQRLIGIQMNAVGLRLLFGEPVRVFNNTVIEGQVVCKSLKTLYQKLIGTEVFEEQVAEIMKWAYQRISAAYFNRDLNRIQSLFFSKNMADYTIHRLCKEGGISDRHMRRLAVEWLGMGPESFMLYNKYLASLHLLHHHKQCSLTQIGLQAGYYDQSHFIRAFRSFTGMTPKEYRLSNTKIPGHIMV
ncbi:MAG: AraC family transcriptional regulator [Haliscomenobacter sp.]|nr:AraC family transcriptional regulator [Haliscomenobacter sp.]MBP9075276.1 AraC family transcriptional regulator [Haliscomenobacter sp.]MBP9872735.1 AraC family transcriptional regulator [Haliscomenobacter sp.]